ncbi:hypothetical protein [Urechidicola vernalis]|uniref:NIPSNAP domain-containing protein n=1 Tax=Urechidicola vernalis TaxID=3075600 RepID=A0ABU2Y273_9FLAO|nr:hypothetical protein [Urechidicola sp. P050]MDT0552308.1 hypothetical protein [Urechidicola sp. P050]
MKIIMFCFIAILTTASFSQKDKTISTIDFVQIVDNNYDELIYYYENNWKVLREMAVKKGYIQTYQVMESPTADSTGFDIILVTTYENDQQYEKRETHFQELIKEKGALKLLNDKKPGDFRKVIYNKENVKQWK